MPTFSDLASAAPKIAERIQARIDATGLCFLGTTRSDGWPRVSGLELFVHDGRVYAGSMPNAVKMQDLRRDPRCCIITPLADKDDMRGEGKLFCRAREVTEEAEWELIRASFLALRGFDMGEIGGSHLFELEVDGAAWQRVENGDQFRTSSWSAAGGVRERARVGALGESVDV
ncbi:MAG: pyridoxamine 5'-phosphate oxidase family protein [Acidimicrobiales bacterium]|nr:pyridoxamine 5'-phosphate oxidase family protein [Acidimicrobiales bacterium]